MKTRGDIVWISLVALGSLLLSLWVLSPALRNPYCIQNDARIHIWWMKTFRNPELFPNDALVELMRSKSWRNPGFVLLFRAASFWFDPIEFSKLLGVLLFPLMNCLLFLTARKISGSSGGITAVLIYSGMSLIAWSSGITIFDGLQRSFRDPILTAGVLGIATASRKIIGAAILSGILFYPPVIPVLIGMLFFKFVSDHRRRLKVRAAWSFIAVAMVLCSLLISARHFHSEPFYGYYGPVWKNPRFLAGGREPIFQYSGGISGIPWFLITGKSGGFFGSTHVQTSISLTLLAIAVLSSILIRRDLQMPAVLKWLIASGFSCFCIAWLGAIATHRFLFYFPSRFSPVILFGVLWTAYAASTGKINPARVLIIPVVVCFFIGVRFVQKTPGYIVPQFWELNLFSVLKTLPPDIMIAGPPDLMNNIPVFAERSVYLSFEMDTEMRDDWGKKRFSDFFQSYYSPDWKTLMDRFRRCGVSHLLIDRRMADPRFIEACKQGISRIYLEPHNSELLRKISGQKEFAITRIPGHRIIFKEGPFVMVDLRSEAGQ